MLDATARDLPNRCRLLRAGLAILLTCLTAPRSEAARGGPDAGGWSWADSREPGVDTTVEPSTRTTIAQPLPDDGVFAVPLSFPFTLYGTTSSVVYLSSNGWLSLIDPGVAPPADNGGLPDIGAPNAAVYYYWDDLLNGGPSFAEHGPTANGHQLLVRHVDRTGSLAQVWIQFYRSGSLKIVYTTTPATASATIAIEDGSGTGASELLRDGSSAPGFALAPNRAVLFFPRSAPSCAGADALSCGTAISGTTSGGGTLATSYGCGDGSYDGRDAVWTFALDEPAAASVTLSGLGARDQDVFILRAGCDGTLDCVAGGGDAATAPLLPAGTYHAVVDGRSAADDGAFDLALSCAPVAEPLACGGTVSGATGPASRIDRYDCRGGDFSGADQIYTFTTTAPQTITARLTPATDFDLILADQATLAAGTASCLEHHDGELSVLNLPAGDWALIVDGPAGASGTFDLDLSCDTEVPAVPIACGDSGVGNDNSGPSMLASYPSCRPGLYPAGEAFYRFTPPARTFATVTYAAADHDLFAFRESEAPGRCRGAGDLSLTLANVDAEAHLLVLDAGSATGATTMSVSCTPMTVTPLMCGDTVAATTAALSQLDDYSCLGAGYDGGEAYFVLDNPTGEPLAVAVDAAVDLDVALFDGPFDAARPTCDGGGDHVARVAPGAPGEYLVVVDGAAATSGSPLQVTVACGASTLACGAATDLPCNSKTAGDTGAGSSTAAVYGGADALFTGPEVVYRFTIPGPDPEAVSLLLHDASDPRLDLILLDACDPDRVLAVGDDTIIQPSLDPGDYLVVVDGREGQSGTFDLVRLCGTGGLTPASVAMSIAPGDCDVATFELYYPPTVPFADVMLSFDLSGSMGQELAQVKANASEIYTALNRLIPSLQFGLASFVEYATAYTDTVCGVSHAPSVPGGYPFLVHQRLTDDIALVDTVLQTVNLIGGAKETYTRTFWESYNNPEIEWRECARRLWLSFGDEPPVDCNIYECTGGDRNTGRDPGPNLITGDADDLELLPTVDGMAANDIVLIPVDSSESALEIDMWQCLAERTGGRVFVTDGDGQVDGGVDIVDGLVGVILDAIRPCPDVDLVAAGPQDAWATIAPASFGAVTTPFFGELEVTICVPPGTTAGLYDLTLEARCAGAGPCADDFLGQSAIEIDVAAPCPAGPVAVVDHPGPMCEGEALVLDASSSAPCSGAGLQYRWLEGPTVVCDWSPSPVCGVTPPATTSYTLEVMCLDAPDCRAETPILVEVVAPPTAAAGPDEALCQDLTVVLDAANSRGDACPSGLEFEWRDGATVTRPWSPDPAWTAPTVIPGTTTYTLAARCIGLDGCESEDEVTVEVELCSLAVRFAATAASWRRTRDPEAMVAMAITWTTSLEEGTTAFTVERAAVAAARPYEHALGPTPAHGAFAAYELVDDEVAAGTRPWYRVVEYTIDGRGDVSAPFHATSAPLGGGDPRDRGRSRGHRRRR